MDGAMVPIRYVFRSRWAALLWGVGICVSAANFADDQHGTTVNAADAKDGKAAQASALLAEDDD